MATLPCYAIESCFKPDYMQDEDIISWAKALDIMQDVSVTNRYQNRLDNLSYDLYGTTDLWWIIGIINDITDPMDFKNYSLKCPYLDDVIEGLTDRAIRLRNSNGVQ